MIERHLMKLRARHEVSAEEAAAIAGAISGVRELPARAMAVERGKRLDFSTLLLEGLLCRQKALSDGVPQVTELHVPGDFADLHSFTLKRLDHDVATLTPCRLATVPHDRLREITEAFPRLARIYWFSTNLDAAIHREWALSFGRRSALARMANLFCELHLRLGIVGLAEGEAFDLPITQSELSECLGITGVHVSRTLAILRESGAADFRGGRVVIQDLEKLRAQAEFDPTYLYLGPHPL